MEVESLEELKTAFAEWRSKKKYSGEAIPDELLQRARLAGTVHGNGRVARAVNVEWRRLRGVKREMRGQASPERTPTFSRVELTAPGSGRPLVELLLANGTMVRLYTEGPGILALLSAVSGTGVGGAR